MGALVHWPAEGGGGGGGGQWAMGATRWFPVLHMHSPMPYIAGRRFFRVAQSLEGRAGLSVHGFSGVMQHEGSRCFTP